MNNVDVVAQRDLLEATSLLNKVWDKVNGVLGGVANIEVENKYYEMHDAIQGSLDQRIFDLFEEEGGFGPENVTLFEELLAQIADTPFQEVSDE